MCCLAVGFLWQWIEVNRRKVEILSHSLAATSRALLSTRGDLALLLAVEARDVAPTEQAIELLLSLDSLIDPHLERYLPLGRLAAGPVAFSPDGRRLVTASLKSILVWDLATGRRLAVLPVPSGQVTRLAFAPDGKTLAAATEASSIMLWAVDNGRPMPASAEKISVKGERLALSPDGKLLVLGGEDGALTLWDIAAADPSAPGPPARRRVTSVAFSPDGRLFLSAGREECWSCGMRARANIGELLRQSRSVTAAAFSRDGKTVAIGRDDGSVRLGISRHAQRNRGVGVDHVCRGDGSGFRRG
jgi:WD40 repeat protein